jgi:hypothetical protein
MTWTVCSDRMGWPEGSVLSDGDLAGCNMKMLVARGVLVPVPDQPKKSSGRRWRRRRHG